VKKGMNFQYLSAIFAIIAIITQIRCQGIREFTQIHKFVILPIVVKNFRPNLNLFITNRAIKVKPIVALNVISVQKLIKVLTTRTDTQIFT
jgi:putative N-acetylmannosamine-6-phosphate epimerase